MEDELTDLTQRFAILDHTWDEERAVMEASRAEASSRANGLALELVQAKAYIHSTLSMEYGQEDDEPSEPQLAFCSLQTELAKREEALGVATVEVAPCGLYWRPRDTALLLIPQWRGSWSIFDIHMTNLERLLETWGLM